MSSVDNRAVHMTFDNASFEKNLAETMKSMDALKKSLDFTNAKKGFAELDSASRGFNLSHISQGIEGVSNKFIAMGTIAVTTLANIVNRAVDAGINVAKALTVAPISEGFSDYNAKLTSVQTITNATGETAEVVNGFFKELDTYADKTVFNLSDMTSALSKFTNAGVSLDVAVPAIKGIANMTALAGQGAGEAAIAMYNLSQSLAGGFLTTTDYKSLNLANVATKQWKDYMIEAAIAAGTLRRTGDDAFEILIDGSNAAANTGQLFNNELSRGWATADILIDVLGDYGDVTTEIGKKAQAAAQDVKSLPMMFDTLKASVGTGWTDTFEIVLGNLEESKALFTDLTTSVSGFLERGATARNELLQGWKDLGGRTKLIEGIKDAFGALYQVLKTISTQFGRFFGTLDSKSLYDLTAGFASLMDRIRNSEDLFDRLNTIFGGIFAALKIGVEIVKGLVGVFADLFNHFSGGAGGQKALDFIDRIALGMISLHDTLVEGGGLDAIFAAITDKLIAFGEALKNPGELLNTIKEAISGFFKGIDFGSFTGIIEAIDRVKTYILDLLDLENLNFDFGFNFDIPDGITDFFKNLFGNVDDTTSNSIDMAGGLDRISTALSFLWDVVTGIGDVIGFFFDKLVDIGSWVLNTGGKVLDFFEELGPNLQKAFMSEEFDKFLEVLQTIAGLMGGAGIFGLGTKGLGINANVDLTGGALPRFNALLQSFVGVGPSVTRTFGSLTDVFKAMQTQIKAKAIFEIAKAIALITASVLVLSFIDPTALAKSLTAMSVGFGQLLGAFAILNVIAAGPKGAVNFAAISTGLIALSTAMLILSGAMAVLATLSWEEIGRGLTGLAGSLLILVAATKLISGGGGLSLIATGIGLSAIAVSMSILAGAVKLFSLMSWEEIGKGLATIAGSLLIMAGTLQLMPATTILIGPGLLAVAFALVELGAAMLIFATMSWEEIGKGLTVLAGGLLIIAGAMNLMPVSTILSGPGLVAIATGLVILGAALKSFGSMKWEEIGKAMTVLASSLLILAGAMALMQGGIPGAIAVGVMAVSLLILNKALKEFAKLSWKELGKGLAGIAAALGVLGLAALALSPVIGNIFLLGIALLALGAGFALIGVGASLLAEAFQIIAAAGTAGIDVLMYAIDQLLIRLPEMARQLAVSILEMADIILSAAPGLIEKLGEVVGALLDLITNNADNFGVAATAWILSMLKVIRDSAPDFIKTAFLLVMEFLQGVKDNAQEYAAAGLGIITEFLKGVTQGIPGFIDAAIELIATFLLELAAHAGELVTAGLAILTSLLDGITDNLDDIEDSVAEFIDRLILEIANLAGDIVDAGVDALIAFLEGLAEDVPEIARNVGTMVTNIMDALADEFVAAVDRAARIVIDFLNDLAEVIRKNDDSLSDAFANLGAAIIEGIIVGLVASAPKLITKIGEVMTDAIAEAGKFWEWGSPSKLMIRLGNDIIDGLVIGLDQNGSDLNHKLVRISNSAASTFQNALASAANALQETSDFNPTITPVLDLSGVQATAAGIQGMLGTKPFTTDVSYQQANQLLAETSQTDNDQDKEEPVRQITFIQTNNSPEELSTARIYKNTRSQIELARKELENV
jgi:hypothetical protein